MSKTQVKSSVSGDLWFSRGEDGNKKLIKIGNIATVTRSAGRVVCILIIFQGVGGWGTFLQTNA